MPSFRDAVAKYNAGQAGVVPVNPPEAARVLETQSTPEVETPKAVAAGSASTPTSQPGTIAPLPETETVKRSRRTKAEMEAARALTATHAPAAPSSPGTTAETSAPPSATAASRFSTEALRDAIQEFQAALPAGVRVTIEFVGL